MGFEIRRNTSSIVKGAVDEFSDLSNIQNPQINDYYLVRKSTGIPFINRKSSGLYYWDGTEWKDDDQDIINKINTLETTIVANALVVSNHESRQDNPHNVTKSQVGLSEVDNTSDLDKPISILTRKELDRLNFRVVYITEDYTLEDSLNFKGTLNIKNVSEKCLNVLTLSQDKIEEEDSLIIYPDESFTVSKRNDNEYRII